MIEGEALRGGNINVKGPVIEGQAAREGEKM